TRILRACTGARTGSSAPVPDGGAPHRPTALESALTRDGILLVASIAAVLVAAWAWIVGMARDMYGPMTGASAWVMTDVWDARHLFLLFAMWTAMMVAMMLPSIAPLLLLYGAVLRRTVSPMTATAQVYALGTGYLVVWTVFSLAATGMQRLLNGGLVLSP